MLQVTHIQKESWTCTPEEASPRVSLHGPYPLVRRDKELELSVGPTFLRGARAKIPLNSLLNHRLWRDRFLVVRSAKILRPCSSQTGQKTLEGDERSDAVWRCCWPL